MKPYKVTVHVTTKYTVETHAETEDDAQAQAEDMDLDQIQNAGELEEFIGVEIVDVEVIHPEDYDDDEDEELDPERFVDLDSLEAPEGSEEEEVEDVKES